MNLLKSAVHLTLCQTSPILFHQWIERSYMVEHLLESTTRETMLRTLQTSKKRGPSRLVNAPRSMNVRPTLAAASTSEKQ